MLFTSANTLNGRRVVAHLSCYSWSHVSPPQRVCCGGTGGVQPLCFLHWPVVWAVMAVLMTASLSQAAALVVRSSQTSVSTSAAAPLQRACDYHNSNRVSIKTFTQESETQIFCVGRLGQISGTRKETCLWFCFIPHWQRWEGLGRLEENLQCEACGLRISCNSAPWISLLCAERHSFEGLILLLCQDPLAVSDVNALF